MGAAVTGGEMVLRGREEKWGCAEGRRLGGGWKGRVVVVRGVTVKCCGDDDEASLQTLM